MNSLKTTLDPLAVDVPTAARLTSLSIHTIRLYIRTGRLKVTRCGRRIMVPVESLTELVREGVPPRKDSNADRKQDPDELRQEKEETK